MNFSMFTLLKQNETFIVNITLEKIFDCKTHNTQKIEKAK
jgi:hypothetical protein